MICPVAAYIDGMHRIPPAPGVDRVRVAGEPEFEAEEKHRRYGVPLHESVAASLRALGAELGIGLRLSATGDVDRCHRRH